MHPDPLEFLYEYESPGDREIVALLASSLAYGRVVLILRNVRVLLDAMGPSPAEFVVASSESYIMKSFPGFRHRFTTGEDVARLLLGARRALGEYGSLNRCFTAGMGGRDDDVVPALRAFSGELSGPSGGSRGFTLPDPEKGSACKRLNLFLRWLVRKDRVDPGGWRGVPRSKLVVPLDTHMYRAGRALGFTSRRGADLKAALEITEGFRRLSPRDPVRYDFALTRLGMRDGVKIAEYLSSIDSPRV